MREWLVALPDVSSIFLKSLKSLALFEFLPTDKVDDVVLDWIGLEKEETKEDSFFDKLAVFLLAGFIILFTMLLLLLMRLCLKKSQRM